MLVSRPRVENNDGIPSLSLLLMKPQLHLKQNLPFATLYLARESCEGLIEPLENIPDGSKTLGDPNG